MATEQQEQQRRMAGWAVGILAGIGPALAHERFVIDGSSWPIALVYALGLAGGAIGGALAVPDKRLFLVGGFTGALAAAGATFVVGRVVHEMRSVSFMMALLLGFAGAAPGLMIGGLFYGMARDWRNR